MKNLERFVFSLTAVAMIWLSVATARHAIKLDWTEALGFVTGAVCVALAVKNNIWNWPIGIANNVFFVVLFLHSRLYADMALQVVYIVLGFLGWYWWLRGGSAQSALPIGTATGRHLVAVAILTVLATVGMRFYLAGIHDSSPSLDALTTCMSLAAQYLLTKKLIQNWPVWIGADIIYVGLYASRHLYLTAILYALFIALCLVGWVEWRGSLSNPVRERREVVNA